MTISDVILHIRYTARQGGDLLGTQALTELRDMLSTASTAGLALLFSLRHDFPTEWSAFTNGSTDFALRLRKDYFPYLVQSKTLAIDALELYAASNNKLTRRSVDVPVNLADDLNGANGYSDLLLAPDASVLKREAAVVFLIVRYSLQA